MADEKEFPLSLSAGGSSARMAAALHSDGGERAEEEGADFWTRWMCPEKEGRGGGRRGGTLAGGGLAADPAGGGGGGHPGANSSCATQLSEILLGAT
jgi:hypothetical protein